MCGGSWLAHKTKQATAKHLALLASLSRLGLSEHMRLQVWLCTLCAAAGGRRDRVAGMRGAHESSCQLALVEGHWRAHATRARPCAQDSACPLPLLG